MQLLHSTLLCALSLLAIVTASGTCTSSGSLSWPPVGDCSIPSKFDTLVKTCRACCLNDGDCFQTCLKAGGISKRETFGKEPLGIIPKRRYVRTRVDNLSCNGNEGCYKFTDGSLLCLDLGTGLYHDDIGGHGSYYSGVYTGPDGKVQTGTSSAATTSRTTQMAQSSVRVQTTSTPVQTTSATATNASASSAAASAISPASRDVFYLGANLGFVCLVAGAFL